MDTAAEIEPATTEPAPDASADLEPYVAFEHAFFRMFPDIYFRVSDHSRRPVIVLVQPDHELVLSFAGFMREFRIVEGEHDARMLARVAEALAFVRGLRVGDMLPSELLNGEASWEPTDEHRATAYNRLTVQLITWLSGNEAVYTDPGQLAQLSEDPEHRKRIREALREAAGRLGLADGEREVVRRIDRLADALSYIEALREIFQEIIEMQRDVSDILRQHQREISISDIAGPVARLLDRAIEEYAAAFRAIDERTGEIVSSIGEIGDHCAYLANERNKLYCRLRVWEELFDLWSPVDGRDVESVAELLRGTYRFLAPRFMEMQEWILSTKARPSQPNPERPKLDLARKRRRRDFSKTMRW